MQTTDRNEVTLFLDFDGVLHPAFCPAEEHFCRRPLFEDVMRRHPAVRIVISSSWRHHYPVGQLRARFSPDIAERIVGTTQLWVPDEPMNRHQDIRTHSRAGDDCRRGAAQHRPHGHAGIGYADVQDHVLVHNSARRDCTGSGQQSSDSGIESQIHARGSARSPKHQLVVENRAGQRCGCMESVRPSCPEFKTTDQHQAGACARLLCICQLYG